MDVRLYLLLIFAIRISAECHYPGFFIPLASQIPCYPNENRGLCCEVGDYCGSSDVCQDSSDGNRTYIGGCKDSSSPGCGTGCPGGSGTDYFPRVEDCRRDRWWCCGEDCCDDPQAFYNELGDVTFLTTPLVPSTSTSSESSTSTSFSSRSSSLTTTTTTSSSRSRPSSISFSPPPPPSPAITSKPPKPRDRSRSVALGAGLGIGFGFLFLAALFAGLWWRKHRKPDKTHMPVPVEDLPEFVVTSPAMTDVNRASDWRYDEPVLVRTSVADGQGAVDGHRQA